MSKFKGELQKLWQGEKTKPLASLAIYTVVILILFGVYLLLGKGNFLPASNETDDQVKEQKVVDPIADLKTQLQESNFRYRYEITINEVKTIYEGRQTDILNEGYKEDSLGTIKYYIDTNSVYEVKLGELYPYTELYKTVDYNLINITNILNLIENVKAKTTTNDEANTYQYEVSYLNQPLTINITVDLNNKPTITINQTGVTYQLQYYDLGIITDSQFGNYPLANQS